MTSITDILKYAKLHPVVAYKWLLRTYGKDVLMWDPDALWITISKDFKVALPRDNKDCIQAVRTVALSRKFNSNWFVFEKVVSGLNAKVVLFDAVQPPSIPEVVFAVQSIQQILPTKFTREVEHYIAAVCMHNGVYKLPDPTIGDILEKVLVEMGIPVQMSENSLAAKADIEQYLKIKEADYDRQAKIFAVYDD